MASDIPKKLLVLNGFILGDRQEFLIEVAEDTRVGFLKDLIKEKNPTSLNRIDSRSLEIWKVCRPLDDPASKQQRSDDPLRPNKRLSSLFKGELSDDDLHILVNAPGIQTVNRAPTRTLVLNYLLYGDILHYRTNGHTIKINANENVASLKNVIKEETVPTSLAKSLTLFKVSLPITDGLDEQLLSLNLNLEQCMEPFSKLSSFFADPTENFLHILVKTPVIEPSSHRSLHAIDELMSRREMAIQKAVLRDVPSAGAVNSALLTTQKVDRADAVYNGRPIGLTAPPLSIFHPLFAKFQREIAEPFDVATFGGTELRNTHQLLVEFVEFYGDEKARISKIQETLGVLVSRELFWTAEIPCGKRSFRPDGVMRSHCEKFPGKNTAAYEFSEVRNGIGEGYSDPIHQAECDYLAYYSDEASVDIRNACCCPAFLLGIAGPFLIISGAIFTDRFVSQPLTDYLFLGGTPYLNDRIYKIAHVLRALKSCLVDLRKFYAELLPASLAKPRGTRSGHIATPCVFPHFRNFQAEGNRFEINYLARLAPGYPGKAVFKASSRHDGQEHLFVVKFTPTYCAAAHTIAYKENCAPKLWFCDEVATVGDGLFVVVMDFVEGQTLRSRTTVSKKVAEQLGRTLKALHRKDYVHGDLRGPNVVVVVDANGDESAKLVDFDWGGKEGAVVYPADINMADISWHPKVCPGGPIRVRREHDEFMLQWLENTIDIRSAAATSRE